MLKSLRAALTAIALLSSTPADACRRNMPIEERIARSGADTVVFAKVERAAYVSEPRYDYHPWDGTLVFKRILKGRTDLRNFRIQRSGSSAACDDGIPAPKSGDKWVVYFKSDEPHALEPRIFSDAYPLDVARQADPGLDKLLTSGDAK